MLPGFSDLGDDDEEHTGQDTPKHMDSISDLSDRTAKMQKEKAEILENFRVLKSSLEHVRIVHEIKMAPVYRVSFQSNYWCCAEGLA